MVHYWGSVAIQLRLGLKSYSGLQGLIAREHLPVYRRVQKKHGERPRRVLYTNDLLLTTWELGQARIEAEQAQARISRKNQQRRDARELARRGEARPAPAPAPAIVTPAQFLRQPNKHDPLT